MTILHTCLQNNMIFILSASCLYPQYHLEVLSPLTSALNPCTCFLRFLLCSSPWLAWALSSLLSFLVPWACLRPPSPQASHLLLSSGLASTLCRCLQVAPGVVTPFLTAFYLSLSVTQCLLSNDGQREASCTVI